MSAFPQGFVTVASALTATTINALWQDALLVACVWLLLRIWPRINAATRYTVWSATLVAAIVVPIATTIPFVIASPRAVSSASIPQTSSHASHRAIPVVRSAHPQEAMTSPAAAQRPPALPERLRVKLPMPLVIAVFFAWVILAAYALVRLAIGLMRLEHLKRDALPLPIEYRDAMSQWMRANKGGRDVRLCVSDETDVPVAVGLFDAMILIPRSLLERLSEAEIDQISLHELAHLRRGDDWTNGFQRLIVALLAWNPAAYFIGQQLDLEREVACDDWVLSFSTGVRPYALCLTKMAETSSWPRHPIPAPGVFATRKHISLRIERLLGAGRNAATNLALGPTSAAIAVVAAIALAIFIIAPSIAMPVATPVFTSTSPPHSSVAPVKTKEIVRYERVAVGPSPAASKPSQIASAAPAAPAVTNGMPVTKAAPNPSAPPVPNAPPIPNAPTGNVVHIPGTHIHVPGQTINVPGVNVDIPGHTFTIPSPRADYWQIMRERGTTAGTAASTAARAAAGTAAGAAARAAAAASSDAQVAQDERSCTDCDFARVNWAGRDMRGVTYTGADFSEANLSGTNFSGGSFEGVDFSRANLRGASFRNARLTGCDFSRANLTGADFTGARLSGCQFTGAQLADAQLRDVLNACQGCDFSRAALAGVDLSGVRAKGDDFSHADLRNVNFAGAELVGIDFSGARLDGANFTGATLNGCDVSGVDLSRVDLSKTKLIGIDFSRRRSSPSPR